MTAPRDLLARDLIADTITTAAYGRTHAIKVADETLEALHAAGYELVKMPPENEDGNYRHAYLSEDEVIVRAGWAGNAAAARSIAASVTRAAVHLSKLEG
jgi:hypothetical protein